ncbi:hypothetical protein L914_12762 [Phytophthora nicotianae]|uniref:Uncharacterized protein n=1 Tax=Phytophthora nicotianae TaxID=4792 RepID=W2MYH1_PHYNI|nr:hypothetical protein L914_12762 [Phytophthora nicotianae]
MDQMKVFVSKRVSEEEDRVLQKHLYTMSDARSTYKEHLLQLQTEYNRGSLCGAVESTVQSVKHFILLARSNGDAISAKEAYATVLSRVTDVIASARRVIRIKPEIVSNSDAPSAEFAETRIQKVFDVFRCSVVRLHDMCREKEIRSDPNGAVLH